MTLIEQVEQCLRDGLAHLYSPTYSPPDLLWSVTGTDPMQGAEAVQGAIIQTIEALRPSPDVPANARIRRLYELLTFRYIQGLTQKETAQRLGITSRHLRREQNEALHLLAQRLCEHRPDRGSLTDKPARVHTERSQTTDANMESSGWRSQVRHELASLQQSTPGVVADVGAAILGAVKSGQALASKYGVGLRVEMSQRDVMSTIHPSVLREVLIATIDKLLHHMSSGEITFNANQERDQVKITIAGYPTTAETPPHSDFVQEALSAQGGSIRARLEDDSAMFTVTLPAADKCAVAVVEDNVDLVHFYRHYTTRTRYQIVHVSESHRAFEVIRETKPDVIVMDIMLPDIDGWELLTQLHEHPETRSIPVIICSVVRREELALAHGAALYVQKPVRRREFIQALDRVLHQIAT